MNARIARLERDARVLGVALSNPTKNSRQFKLDQHHTITFKPQGKGTMQIEMRHEGCLETQAVMRDDKIKELLMKARTNNGG